MHGDEAVCSREMCVFGECSLRINAEKMSKQTKIMIETFTICLA